MFRSAIRKGWVTGDISQKEGGLAAQQCWSQQVLPRATSRVNTASAACFMVHCSSSGVPSLHTLNTDRTRIAHSWSFLVKREQHWVQHSQHSTLLHNKTPFYTQQICGIHRWQWECEHWGCPCGGVTHPSPDTALLLVPRTLQPDWDTAL